MSNSSAQLVLGEQDSRAHEVRFASLYRIFQSSAPAKTLILEHARLINLRYLLKLFLVHAHF